MGKIDDHFQLAEADETSETGSLLRSGSAGLSESRALVAAGVTTATFHGFDLDNQPLVSGLAELPGELVRARATVRLLQAMTGDSVVLLFEQADLRRPIIVGVLQDQAIACQLEAGQRLVSVEADDDRFVVSAEREIVLRCGDASITLTRAGKVIIKGNYILSRSSGYNKIKGAAVDIN
jgi:hypothetical protein